MTCKKQVAMRTFMTFAPVWLDLSSFRFDSDKRNLLENRHFDRHPPSRTLAGNQLSACFTARSDVKTSGIQSSNVPEVQVVSDRPRTAIPCTRSAGAPGDL